MTSLLLKLVNNSIDKLITIDKAYITLFDIHFYLISNNMHLNEVEQIMFINNGKNLDKERHSINGTDDNPAIIHMYTNNVKIKDDLIKYIFTNTKEQSSEMIEIADDKIEVSQEEQTKHNLKTIELFSDKDFVYLLKIIINKPELINLASSYIISGNIVKKFELKDTKEEFKYNNELIEVIKLLNKLNDIDYDENKLKSIINHFEGNLNLTIRYIITTGSL